MLAKFPRRLVRLVAVTAVCISALAVSASGSAGDDPVCGAPLRALRPSVRAIEQAEINVTIQSSTFIPNAVTINQGDSVKWTNQDSLFHTATSNTGVWDTGALGEGENFSFTFNTQGIFPYFCAFHEFMTGTITVAGPSPTPTPTPMPSPSPTPTPSPSPTAMPSPSPGGTPFSFTEGFDTVTAGVPAAGWFAQNNSTPVGSQPTWFQGNTSVFTAHAGPPSSYIAANFNLVAGTGTISAWLLTPEFPLANGFVLEFWTRSAGAFPDRLQVRMSTAGSSTNVGTTNTSVGDFTNLLLDINPTYSPGEYPTVWTEQTVTISGLPGQTSGRLAFRYFVENSGPTGTNGDYIGIDTFSFTGAGCACATPTPTQPPPTPTPSPAQTPLYTRGDYDGDNKTDITVWRPSAFAPPNDNLSAFYTQRSSDLSFFGIQFGNPSDVAIAGDFDGDNKTDFGVSRYTTAIGVDLIYLESSTNTVKYPVWGNAGDIFVSGDYDGDKKTDVMAWRPSNGTWYIESSRFGTLIQFVHGQNGDKPYAMDTNGDGRANAVYFRPSTGNWVIRGDGGPFPPPGTTTINFGLSTDIPVPADYDGDNKDDIAVFRDGMWIVLKSSSGQVEFTPFGSSGDVPVPGDYDGDNLYDRAVYRAGIWHMLRSTAGYTGFQFGAATDTPMPKAYIP